MSNGKVNVFIASYEGDDADVLGEIVRLGVMAVNNESGGDKEKTPADEVAPRVKICPSRLLVSLRDEFDQRMRESEPDEHTNQYELSKIIGRLDDLINALGDGDFSALPKWAVIKPGGGQLAIEKALWSQVEDFAERMPVDVRPEDLAHWLIRESLNQPDIFRRYKAFLGCFLKTEN